MGPPRPFAALVFTLALGLTIFLPLALATYQIAQQSGFLLGWIARAREQGIPVPEWAVQLPIAASAITEWWRENLTDPKMAAAWLEYLQCGKLSRLDKNDRRPARATIIHVFRVTDCVVRNAAHTDPGSRGVCWTRQIVFLAIPARGSQARWSWQREGQ